MNNKYYHIAIALAGTCQSALLVPQLANTGTCNAKLYEQAIKSLFIMSPKTTLDVYNGKQNIRSGVQALINVFSSQKKEDLEIVRYLFSILALAHKLLKNSEALTKIDQRLTRISTLYTSYTSTSTYITSEGASTSVLQSDKNVILDDEKLSLRVDDISYSLAGIYSDIISPLSSKIKVIGKIEYLQNSLVQAKVRTSLLCSIRSAILWYQVGGRRVQFLFSRKKILLAAQDLLQEINNGVN